MTEMLREPRQSVALGENRAHANPRCRVTPISVPGSVHDLLRMLGIESDAMAMACPLAMWRVRSGATLFHEGAHAESIFFVRSGTFKCLKTSEDGYEQVLGFVGQAEVLGFEGLCGERESVSAVALEDSSVFAVPLRELDTLRQTYPGLDHGLQLAVSSLLVRAGELAEMMAAVAAEVRLARFLVWLSSRMAERGQSPTRLRLRMSRRDIASLLGVAHETVSRSFSTLVDWGYLRVENREVEIIDLPGLRICTRSTRRMVDDEAPRPDGVGRVHAHHWPRHIATH